jgi:hypothetical protein
MTIRMSNHGTPRVYDNSPLRLHPAIRYYSITKKNNYIELETYILLLGTGSRAAPWRFNDAGARSVVRSKTSMHTQLLNRRESEWVKPINFKRLGIRIYAKRRRITLWREHEV